MKIGQTSLIVFLAKLFGSILGFISTVYFARILGAELLGVYAVVIAVVGWLGTFGRIGINSGIKKRISEGTDQEQYFVSGTLLIVFTFTLLVVLIFLFRGRIEGYIGEFEEYSSISVVFFIIVILGADLLAIPIKTTLRGLRLVHIAGVLNPVKISLQSIIQIGLVFVGFGLTGMLIGYAAGIVIATLIGLPFISLSLKRPQRKHFKSILAYAKYAWISGLRSRTFNDVDIVVLGAFASNALVGIYSVAWTLSTFLSLFSNAISEVMFPEISYKSAQNSTEGVTCLIEDMFAYAGFVTIPGLAGGILLDDRLLRIYSDEFVQGTEVFWLLLLSVLLYSFLGQQLNALNALDRPDLALRANVLLIVSNAFLNIVLIWKIGWIGAAIASATSVLLTNITSYLLLTRLVTVHFPVGEIVRQVVAAIIMGALVGFLRLTIESTEILQHNFAIVLGLVSIGASVYVLVLLAISSRFRETVDRNLPVNIPFTDKFDTK